jgi:hypothetical protein
VSEAIEKTASITRILWEEGIRGPQADMIAYEMLLRHSPKLVAAIERLVQHGYTPDRIAQDMREEARRIGQKPDEAHIANCMAVARDIKRRDSYPDNERR